MQPQPPLTPAVFFILFALADGEKHGYVIMQSVEELSDGKVRLGPATLYTAIARMLEAGDIQEISHPEDERRRFYRLTRQGKILLRAELDRQEAVLRKARKFKLLRAESR